MKATSVDIIHEEIEHLELLRNKMIHTAKTLGIQHPLVLSYSKQIDETHNKIMRLELKDE